MIRHVPFSNDMDIALPFEASFNFTVLRERYEAKIRDQGLEAHPEFHRRLELVKAAKELYTGTRDEATLLRHQEALDLLTADLFPSILQGNEIKTIGLPFSHIYVRPTARLTAILDSARDKKSVNLKVPDADHFYVLGCLFILRMHYGVSTRMNKPYFMHIDRSDGSRMTLRLFINADSCVFAPTDKSESLSKDDIKELLSRPEDIKLWKKRFPPGGFKMEGFTIINMFDVTIDETLDHLKWYLVKRDALSRKGSRDIVKQALATFIGSENFKVGLSRYDQKTGKLARHTGEGWKSYALSGHMKTGFEQMYCKDTADRLRQQHKYVAWNSQEEIDQELPGTSPHVIKYLHEKGYQSAIFIPLIYGDELIGLLELISKEKNLLSPMTYNVIETILPVLTVSLYSFIENRQTQIESIIQQNYTSLHPSIAWRFEEAAEAKLLDPDTEDEDITFSQVFPLFGQADIMSSSEIRNRAIQSDLSLQLRAARSALDMEGEYGHLPIIKHLAYELDKRIHELNSDLSAGDELELLEFIHSRVNPVLQWMRADDRYASYVKSYDALLDPQLGIVYRDRKRFESSVSMINKELSDFFLHKQQEAQRSFPHYCEIYKTDGVEYNLYIGQSIQPSRTFEDFHLQNLRLWQLMTCCEQENLFARLRPSLPLDLEIRSLILSHDSPMAIKFRIDEKKFDVDGAYNIRYEIVKKRIDKAVIIGSGERLTKTGHLTVVYSQDKERDEYEQYFAYLVSINYLDAGAEHLVLEDMPGATGLRAMRAPIRYAEDIVQVGEHKVVSMVS